MMQRPRNRQGRPPPQNGRARGRGGGGHRGGRQERPALSHNVPSTQQVVAGSFVSIVLKIDQPTGREVQGIVADVLTSGNHPRGIKVRLVDGRVGRVQRMVTEDEARAGSAGLSGLGRNGEVVNGQHIISRPAAPPGSRIALRYRDVREEKSQEPPSNYSLGDFLPLGHPLRESPITTSSLLPEPLDVESTSQVCPVCGEFEGDEVAVSHHVATHFD
ncbi:hypothetical protein M430DRAFT_20148 [Amorphotheca resinae ATCC 22711]|uniref:UBZ4-type domain-containing protein n=1 Tax=Amorphotheca resinae ATCC 22711 TaxID=857342 RepID=A0A2T3AXN9_AMORE|nr:hypothetical protein M430DRAFT_20148 [Amorphotheca resinae ATCC 22711]PSS14825.1 hypothetical protein M430DRAFT_20148 [Amorphotheca resinae ATCC 22711]